MTRWRGLFCSMAVPTLVFICPLVALTSSLSWLLFLTWPEITKELSVRFIALLVMEGMAAAMLCAALAPLKWLRLPSSGMYQMCRGNLNIAILDVPLILATRPLWVAVLGAAVTPGYIKLSALAIEGLLIVQVGWERIFQVFDRLNR